jgi:hypothetical protein
VSSWRAERKGWQPDGVEWIRAIADLAGAVLWPGVVAGIVWIFRSQIAALIDRIQKLKAGPVEITTEDLRESVKALAAEPSPADVTARRTEIARLMTYSAEWGWSMAQIGFQSPPRPVIEWDGDEPQILFGQATH